MSILKPLLKYPGGKSSELKSIIFNLPNKIDNYIEPFLGGGAVYLGISANEYYVNDISEELMLLYRYVKNQDGLFFSELEMIDKNWNQLREIAKQYLSYFYDLFINYRESKINQYEVDKDVHKFVKNLNGELNRPLFAFEGIDSEIFKDQLRRNLFDKIKRIKKNEVKNQKVLDEFDFFDNLETAFKSAYYMHFRDLYNSAKKTNISPQRRVAIFFFVREYCFSSMFRFNRKGEFNVPYGGISYNKKSMSMKIKYFKSKDLISKLTKTTLYTLDFKEFFNSITLSENDFIFLDPPYDTVFSEYDQNEFNQNDQVRLADYLLNECVCKFILVIKKTDFISGLYKNKGLNIIEIEKNYSVSFRNRNKRQVTHLMIKNY